MKIKPAFLITAFFAVLALLLMVPFAIVALNEGRDVPVLMYHGFADNPEHDVWTVSTEEFERQMREMKAAGRKSILPNQLALAARGLYLLPAKPVVITMDDGFRNNVTLAEPIMRKYGMKGIEYLIISHIGDSETTRSQYRDCDNLVWPEVREALTRGTLTFGSHSISHTPNARHQAKEVTRSRHILHEKTGRKANAYCYPNGYAPDILREAVTYKHRFTTAMCCSDAVFRFSRKADFYRIPRVSIYGGTHAFSIRSMTWENGKLSAAIANKGTPIPVRALLREKGTNRSFLSDGDPIWLGRRGQKKPQVFQWTNLPPDLSTNDLEVVVSEQNGLFTYGEPKSLVTK